MRGKDRKRLTAPPEVDDADEPAQDGPDYAEHGDDGGGTRRDVVRSLALCVRGPVGKGESLVVVISVISSSA